MPMNASSQSGKVSNNIKAAPTRSYNSFTEMDQETPGALLNTIIVLPERTSREGRAIEVLMKSVESHASTPSVSQAPIVSWILAKLHLPGRNHDTFRRILMQRIDKVITATGFKVNHCHDVK